MSGDALLLEVGRESIDVFDDDDDDDELDDDDDDDEDGEVEDDVDEMEPLPDDIEVDRVSRLFNCTLLLWLL